MECFRKDAKVSGRMVCPPQLYARLIYQTAIHYFFRSFCSKIEHDFDEACRKNFILSNYGSICFTCKITLHIMF